MSPFDYVHGYSSEESRRLEDQASTLSDLLHHDSVFPPGSTVLEAGCGVGSQTLTLARRNPDVSFTSIDISEDSLREARRKVEGAGLRNVTFARADLFDLPFEPGSFDHAFVCFVLEHLTEPEMALERLAGLIEAGGTITVIEGDHESAFFHPASRDALVAIRSLVELQASRGGDALIGRRLYPLLETSGYSRVTVSPRMVYVDSSKPELVDGFIRNTFTAMVEGVREQAVGGGFIDAETFERGVSDLYRTAETGGTFCYTFFKATGVKKD